MPYHKIPIASKIDLIVSDAIQSGTLTITSKCRRFCPGDDGGLIRDVTKRFWSPGTHRIGCRGKWPAGLNGATLILDWQRPPRGGDREGKEGAKNRQATSIGKWCRTGRVGGAKQPQMGRAEADEVGCHCFSRWVGIPTSLASSSMCSSSSIYRAPAARSRSGGCRASRA
jgi:hypothetical protein